MSDQIYCDLTMYGFKWGPAEVTRCHERDGAIVMEVKTDTGKHIQIYVSRTGKSLRVFNAQGQELKAVDNG